MAHVISVANQKGGCGKTTISMNIAGCLGRADYRVLLIDADPQQSAMNWKNNVEQSTLPFEVALYPYPNIHVEVRERFLNKNYDVILIDCPPGASNPGDRKSDITRSALMCSHAVIVPVQPTPIDYRASFSLVPLLQDVSFSRINNPLQVFIVINRKLASRSRLGAEASTTATQAFAAEGLNVHVLKSEVCSRQTFQEAPLYGLTVTDHEPNSKAAGEIVNLTKEMMECLNHKSVAA
jgi:chromosome partitioning protein